MCIQRNLIFDYLCHNAFTDTARAFVRESTVKSVDADGDEVMSAEALGHSDLLAESMDDKLIQAELRRGQYARLMYCERAGLTFL